MNLKDLNPEIIDDRILSFDCPLHKPLENGEWNIEHKCGGKTQVLLSPYVSDPNHHTPGWPWHGNISNWEITLGHSVRNLLCGVHFYINNGIVTID